LVHGAHILYGRTSACIDPEVKRSTVKVSRSQVIKCAAGVGMHVDMTAPVSSFQHAFARGDGKWCRFGRNDLQFAIHCRWSSRSRKKRSYHSRHLISSHLIRTEL